MILIYSSPLSDKKQIDNTIDKLVRQLSIFFIGVDDFIYTTETNPILLRGIFLTNKISLLYTHSIKEMGLSPTEISELIIFILKNGNDGKGGEFQSEADNLYLTKDNIDIVYPSVFEVFRNC